MADSFGGTTIRVRTAECITKETQSAYHAFHYPGGDNNTTDYGGKKQTTLELPLHFATQSAANTISAMQDGTARTLVYKAGTFTATLVGWRETILISGDVLVTATFII